MMRTRDALGKELFGADWKDTVMRFNRGDIVRVEYSSPRMLDEWLSGERPVGPGDLGVVKYATALHQSQHEYDAGWANWNGIVTVEFPMIGCYGVHSANLRLVQRAGASDAER